MKLFKLLYAAWLVVIAWVFRKRRQRELDELIKDLEFIQRHTE